VSVTGWAVLAKSILWPIFGAVSSGHKFATRKTRNTSGDSIAQCWLVIPVLGGVKVLTTCCGRRGSKHQSRDFGHGQVGWRSPIPRPSAITVTEEVVYDQQMGQILCGSLCGNTWCRWADGLSSCAWGAVFRSRGASLSPNNPSRAKAAGKGGIFPVGGALAKPVAAALCFFWVCKLLDTPFDAAAPVWRRISARKKSHSVAVGKCRARRFLR